MKIKSILVCLLIAAALIGCNKKDKKAETPKENTKIEKENKQTKQIAVTPNNSLEPIEIAFGDFDAMSAFSKKCQNNELPEGQPVIIDGEMSVHFRSASIGQKKEGEYVGTSLYVNGWEEDNYPGDESRVKIKAFTVLEKEYFYLYLVADPADVEIINNTKEAEEESAE